MPGPIRATCSPELVEGNSKILGVRILIVGLVGKERHLPMTREQSDLPKLAAPARRALAGAGILRLEQLSRMSEGELAQLHGIGPNAIETIRRALKEQGLSFLPENKKP
jgi:hypothetical protein